MKGLESKLCDQKVKKNGDRVQTRTIMVESVFLESVSGI